MSKMRKMVVMVLMFAMVVQISHNEVEASAAVVNATAATVSISVKNRNATCKAVVTGKTGVTKYSGEMRLQKIVNKKASTVKTWNISEKCRVLKIDKSYSVGQGQYKLILSVDVYKGSAVQHITMSDSTFSL